MYTTEPGFGIFGTEASGCAISKHSIDQLQALGPQSFSKFDTQKRNIMGFGGGASGPLRGITMGWGVTENPNTHDRTPAIGAGRAMLGVWGRGGLHCNG